MGAVREGAAPESRPACGPGPKGPGTDGDEASPTGRLGSRDQRSNGKRLCSPPDGGLSSPSVTQALAWGGRQPQWPDSAVQLDSDPFATVSESLESKGFASMVARNRLSGTAPGEGWAGGVLHFPAQPRSNRDPSRPRTRRDHPHQGQAAPARCSLTVSGSRYTPMIAGGV